MIQPSIFKSKWGRTIGLRPQFQKNRKVIHKVVRPSLPTLTSLKKSTQGLDRRNLLGFDATDLIPEWDQENRPFWKGIATRFISSIKLLKWSILLVEQTSKLFLFNHLTTLKSPLTHQFSLHGPYKPESSHKIGLVYKMKDRTHIWFNQRSQR